MSAITPMGWGDEEQQDVGARLNLIGPLRSYRTHAKRGVDLIVGSILLVLAGPLVLLAMLLVFITLGRPVIYRQQRVGLDGQWFELYKLRTMVPDRRRGESNGYIGPERREVHKSREDPRVGRVGAWLRALRLDELPQFWNVIKGDMSLVGPRPELPDIVAEYEDWQHLRHTVKPGLTGLWQVSAPNGKLMHECTELDLEYISRISLRTDLGILVKTPSAMVRRRGF